MSLVLDATVGGPASNTYCTVAEADAILAARLHTEAWFTDVDLLPLRPQALAWATALLDDQVLWYGTPTTPTQALAFPMTGLVDRYGRPVDASTIPAWLKEAEALYALQLLQTPAPAAGVQSSSGIKSKKIGDLTITYQDDPTAAQPTTSSMPLEVKRLLRWYANVPGSMMVPLFRV